MTTSICALVAVAAFICASSGATFEGEGITSSMIFEDTVNLTSEGMEDAGIFADIAATSYCVAEHNRERAKNGKPALTADSRLEAAAARHNDVMQRQNCFSHQCAGELSLGDRVKAAGYRFTSVGENLAGGYPDCNAAIGGWLRSDGHRANLLGNWRHVGCHKLGSYITCDFGNPA